MPESSDSDGPDGPGGPGGFVGFVGGFVGGGPAPHPFGHAHLVVRLKAYEKTKYFLNIKELSLINQLFNNLLNSVTYSSIIEIGKK